MNVLNNLRKKGTSPTLGEDELSLEGLESVLVFTTKPTINTRKKNGKIKKIKKIKMTILGQIYIIYIICIIYIIWKSQYKCHSKNLRNRPPYPRFAVHVLNCCKVCTLLSF